MAMEEVLDSVRRIISRWTVTNTSLTADAHAGDTTLTVNTARGFSKGDEATILTPIDGEANLVIKEVTDRNTIILEEELSRNFYVSQTPILHKTTNGLFVQGVYLGDPDVIPMYPAITVSATNRTSEWLTLDSTKEEYGVKVNIYVQDSTQENAYRFLLKLTDIIQNGLKQNIYPLVAPYKTTSITQDIAACSEYLKVSDSSIFMPPKAYQRIIIEDPWKSQETIVTEVIDAHTIRVDPVINEAYLLSDRTQVIGVERFIYNSWPSDIDYGYVFKGTMLKAATITWFAMEEEYQRRGGTQTTEPTLL